MKFFATAIFSFGLCAMVAAQDCLSVAEQVPSCGQPCLESAAGSVGCGVTDFNCQCSSDNQSKIRSAATSCVISSCSYDDAIATQNQAEAVCSCEGMKVKSRMMRF